MDEGSLLEGLTASSGIPYLRWYLEYLVKSLGLRQAFIGELSGQDLDSIRTLCVQGPQGLIPNFEYSLADTPCREVLEQNTCAWPSRVQELFPEDPLLVDLGIESYLAVPLHDKSSRPLGLVALLDDKPMSARLSSIARETLLLFQPRCAAVLEHRRLVSDMERVLEAENAKGADRLGELCRALARTLSVKVAFVVRILPGDPGKFESLALSIDGGHQSTAVRSREGTPFQDLADHRHFYIESRVRSLYPEDEFLESVDAESVYGVQFTDAKERALGYVGVISDRPLDPGIVNQPLFGFFSRRIAAELERHQDEEARRDAEKKLNAVQRMESLGVLAGGIAHDFNNLLTSILGNAELARGDLAGQALALTHLAEIEVASRKAADLCRQMLIYSGKSRLERQRLSLNTLISEIGSLLEVSLSKKCQLEMDLAEGLSAIEADSAGLQQVILNLIQNAAESLEGRVGRVKIRTEQTHLREEDLKAMILGDSMEPGCYQVLEVEDDGKGMPPDLLARIFDPFFTTKEEGHGLGLAAMLGILRGHKAGALVSSWPGQGTRFQVFLPTKAAAEPLKENPKMLKEQETATSRILVVDDESSVRDVAAQALKLAGHEVQTA